MTLSSLIVPIENHVIYSLGFFSNLFNQAYDFVLSEKSLFKLGSLASIAFLIMLFKAISLVLNYTNLSAKNNISKNENSELTRFLIAINLLTFLVFCGEGFYVFVNLFAPFLRGIARLNIAIIFIALLFVGLFFDKIILQKIFFNKVILNKILVLTIAFLSLIDAVGKPDLFSKSFLSNQNKYLNNKTFVNNIENSLPVNSKIFVMPVRGFPEEYYDNYSAVSGYFFSKNLHFSYPMPKGRKSELRQKLIEKLPADQLVQELKKEGFAGIWIVKKNITKDELEKNQQLQIYLQKNSAMQLQDQNQEFIFYKF
jgi:hypothetical protein